MKNLINKIGVLTVVFSLFLVSCETVDFGDENVNPNSPTSKKTDALLTTAMGLIVAIPALISHYFFDRKILLKQKSNEEFVNKLTSMS